MAEHFYQAEKQQTEHEKPTRRIRKITFRLSESEYAQISDDMAACGLSISFFARKRLLGVHVAYRADLAVLSKLRRLGWLLKHVHNETRGAYSSLTAQTIRSPIDMAVQQLDIHTTGAVVTTAQPLMQVVPEGVRIQFKIWAINRDGGDKDAAETCDRVFHGPVQNLCERRFEGAVI